MAVLVNLLTQRLVFNLVASDGIDGVYWFALATGTFFGFICKYLADKLIVFRHSAAKNLLPKEIGLYASTSLLTTAIFWICETLFWIFWRTDLARESGAFIGLSLGYLIKYQLDKRIVF